MHFENKSVVLMKHNKQRYVWMLRACVAANSMGNISLTVRRMGLIKHQLILKANITQSFKKLKILNEDNDFKHTSNPTMVYLKRLKF